jgi:hypothetical protein
MSFSCAITEGHSRVNQSRLASLKVGAAGVKQRLDPLVRREKFHSPEQTQRGDVAFAAQASEWLIELDRDSIGRDRANIDKGDIEKALIEAEIENDLRLRQCLLGDRTAQYA